MKARELTLFESACASAQQMPDNVFTSPDDDWLPVLFLEGKAGSTVVPLHEYIRDDVRKDMLATVLIPAIIEEVEATSAVMVISTWTSAASGAVLNESGEYLPPSQQPDREEAVWIIEYTRDGVTRHACAKIMRSETEVPRLGEWEDLGVKSMDGRFVEPIVKALKAVPLRT